MPRNYGDKSVFRGKKNIREEEVVGNDCSKSCDLEALHSWCLGTSAWVPAQNGAVFKL